MTQRSTSQEWRTVVTVILLGIILGLTFITCSEQMGFAQQSSNKKTFEASLGSVAVGLVPDSGPIQVPFILWGGDVPTLMANGGLTTTKDSLYGQAGLNLNMVPGDDFPQQVKDYISGKSPYLRGTYHMLGLASEVINRDPRTKPVMIYQLTWSIGDHIVARENIKTLNDLKGKKICCQADGPHLGLIDDSLKAAGLAWTDVTIVYAKNLTGDDSPAALIRSDPSIDAACVISPDMLGLCSAIDQKGSGAEGTLKGSHVVNSTASMSRSISDVYVVRKDYWEKHRPEVEKFFVGYLKATESLLAAKQAYNDGKGSSPPYMAMLGLAQKVYGQKTLPSLEVDAHGLVSDAVFVRLGGNELFFNDPNNLVGFTTKQTDSLDLAFRLGHVKEKLGFEKAGWDYKNLAQLAGIKYAQPTFTQGRIKGEVTDFNKDLDSNTIATFNIVFEPDQTTFTVESYAADFKRVVESIAKFGNSAILIRGHSDPTLSLQNFVWAARAKGLIAGEDSNYTFKGNRLNLTDTQFVVDAIQAENLAGLQRRNRDGQMVSIDDPKTTVAAALQLSQTRATTVKTTIEAFAKAKGLPIDLSQIRPVGVGISEPIHARPRNMQQAKENMRVEFRLIRVKAEALTDDNFNFDK